MRTGKSYENYRVTHFYLSLRKDFVIGRTESSNKNRTRRAW